MAGGRKSKLTPEVMAKICEAIRAGNYFETACQYAGISHGTGYEWKSRGEGTHKARPTSPEFAEFADAVKKAEADAEVHSVGLIKKAAVGGTVIKTKTTIFPDGRKEIEETRAAPQWQAAAWYLERKHHERWGRVVKQEVSGPGGSPLVMEGKNGLSQEDRASAISQILDRGRNRAPGPLPEAGSEMEPSAGTSD